MAIKLSQSISDRYALILSDQLIEWFDCVWSQYRLEGEFHQPLAPYQLLEDSLEALWPGFMLPDTIPIITNDYGDWLCLRVGANDEVSEVLHWYHGGGDFLPFGSNLAEALLYDVCQFVGRKRTPWDSTPSEEARASIWPWLAKHLQSTEAQIVEIVEGFRKGQVDQGLTMLAERGWCRDAVDRDRIDRALGTPLRQIADPKLALRLGVTWEREMTRWLFDTKTIPDSYRTALQELFEPRSDWDSQDWTQAESIAEGALNRRSDLAWASDVSGWGAFRRQDYELAFQRWEKGLLASVFSDQSTMFRSHWFSQEFGKFSAAMLYQSRDRLPESMQANLYWQNITRQGTLTANQRATEYWYQIAKAESNAAAQYEAWYRAGWDVGCTNRAQFQTILSGLVDSAWSAGWKARHAVAKAHLNKLGT